MKISVLGLGYVCLANDLLLSQSEDVIVFDIVIDKIEMLKKIYIPLKILRLSHF